MRIWLATKLRHWATRLDGRKIALFPVGTRYHVSTGPGFVLIQNDEAQAEETKRTLEYWLRNRNFIDPRVSNSPRASMIGMSGGGGSGGLGGFGTVVIGTANGSGGTSSAARISDPITRDFMAGGLHDEEPDDN